MKFGERYLPDAINLGKKAARFGKKYFDDILRRIGAPKGIPDDAFVRFDPSKYDKSISELGIQKRFFSDEKIWLTKYGDIKDVENAKELETILYRKNLWPSVEGRFSEGATMRVVNNVDDAVAAGVTNRTNGVRQWKITRDVSPNDLDIVGRISN